MVGKLRDLLTSVCDYAHERVAQLLSVPLHAQASEQRDKSNTSQKEVRSGEKQGQTQNTLVCILLSLLNVYISF